MRHKKNLKILVIPILLIILIPFKANAKIITENIYTSSPDNSFTITSVSLATQLQSKLFQGQGEGYVIFTTRQFNINTNATEPVMEVQVYDNNNVAYTCDMGNQQWYNDNNKEYYVNTYKCYIDLRGTNVGLQGFVFKRAGAWGQIGLQIGDIVTYVGEENQANAIINANAQAIQSVINSEQANAQAITNAINSSTTQAHNDSLDLQGILDDMGQMDLDESDKVQPNQDEYDNVEGKEEVVYDNLDDLNIGSLIDINVDADTSTWIWNLITSILNVNRRVKRLFLTILSLGLCKFILGR